MKSNRIVFWFCCVAGLAALAAAFGSPSPLVASCPSTNSTTQPYAFCCNETKGVTCNQYYKVSATDQSKVSISSDSTQTCDANDQYCY